MSDLQPGNAGATGSIQSEAVNVVARRISEVISSAEIKKHLNTYRLCSMTSMKLSPAIRIQVVSELLIMIVIFLLPALHILHKQVFFHYIACSSNSVLHLALTDLVLL